MSQSSFGGRLDTGIQWILHMIEVHICFTCQFLSLFFGFNSLWMLACPTLSVNLETNEEISRGYVYTFLDTLCCILVSTL